MFLTAGTALIVSGGSVLAAHKVAQQHQNREITPALSEKIQILFPQTTQVMQKFERHVKVHAETGINPVPPATVKLVRTFYDCSRSLALYVQNPNVMTEKQVRRSVNKFWKASERKQFSFYNKSGPTQKEYLKALRLQRDGLSEEFLDITFSMLDSVFNGHIMNTIKGRTLYSPSMHIYTVDYRILVENTLEQWQV